MAEKILLYFFIYAFLGWCTEVVYAAVEEGKFVNRGFLSGPLCPIYGFGVLFVLYLLDPYKSNLPILFLGAVLITSSIELFGGFTMEKIFHQRWWDYSDKKFNFHGYICLSFSIIWGLACVIVVDRIHPFVTKVTSLIPDRVGWILVGIFSFLFVIDFVASVLSAHNLGKRLKHIQELSQLLKDASDDIGSNLAERTINITEKTDSIKEKIDKKKTEIKKDISDFKEDKKITGLSTKEDIENTLKNLSEKLDFGQSRLLKAFPKMKSKDNESALNRLKERFNSK